MNITIRPIMEEDYDNVVNASADEGWTTYSARRRDFVDSLDKSLFLVAYDGNKFAGYARAISDGHITTYLCELLVVKTCRRKGVGRMLVERVRETFPKTRVDLISEADGFYDKIGFRAIGTGFRKSGA